MDSIIHDIIVAIIGGIVTLVLGCIVYYIKRICCFLKLTPNPENTNNKKRIFGELLDKLIKYENLLNKFWGYKFSHYTN